MSFFFWWILLFSCLDMTELTRVYSWSKIRKCCELWLLKIRWGASIAQRDWVACMLNPNIVRPTNNGKLQTVSKHITGGPDMPAMELNWLEITIQVDKTFEYFQQGKKLRVHRGSCPHENQWSSHKVIINVFAIIPKTNLSGGTCWSQLQLH